ncbi:MAG: 2-C-methyl-D-erythritol 2,4-cyclodiphosphate synthase [Longimicrobiales bacterium]
MRVGIGYDSHRFDPARSLVLGGVVIPGAAGLSGHSDADAVAHAVTDAILGAACLGDIGAHFPPDDARWKHADSIELLRAANTHLGEHNFQVVNVDVTVVCESPRLSPHIQGMRERLADALGIASANVSVKGKSNEGMGWVGRGEGVAAVAVALVDRIAG